MKKIICLLVLLSLASGVQAGDKKKKSSSGGSAPARASGGGNRGGGGLPGMSSTTPVKILAVYLVEKGKPLAEPVP